MLTRDERRAQGQATWAAIQRTWAEICATWLAVQQTIAAGRQIGPAGRAGRPAPRPTLTQALTDDICARYGLPAATPRPPRRRRKERHARPRG